MNPVLGLQTGNWCKRSERPLRPQAVSSQEWSRCVFHEGPVLRPQGSADDYARAAFFVLRARAAKNSNLQSGLIAALRRILKERLVSDFWTFAAPRPNSHTGTFLPLAAFNPKSAFGLNRSTNGRFWNVNGHFESRARVRTSA